MKAVNMSGNGYTAGIGVNGGHDQSGSNKEKEKAGQVKNGVLFAGNMAGTVTDRIEQKKQQARKQANKRIMNQFAQDNKTTDSLRECRDRIKELQSAQSELRDKSLECQGKKEALKETYGVAEDSQEQKDLELLEKANEMNKTGSLSSLSKEELDRIQEMGPLSEYQQNALAYDRVSDAYDMQIDRMNNQIAGERNAIYETKQGMLKQHGMADAKKAANSILDAASDSIMGMLYSEAKQHVDEEMEKLVEAAKEASEKKEEEEKKQEGVKEEKQESQELTEKIQESAGQKETVQEDVQQEINKIMTEAGVQEEDWKGIIVNEQI